MKSIKKDKINWCITGGQGFIGSNLFRKLLEEGETNIELFNSDISIEFVPDKKPDIIFHLAANTHTTESNDIEMYRNNILIFLNVLEYACDNKIRMIYASSGAVYGNGVGPLNAYGESKRMIDRIAQRFYKKIPLVGLRFFNVFGPNERQKGNMASMITQWREQIEKEERPVIFKGKFKRDFIYVKDIVKALLVSKNLRSGIYDVGTGIATDFRDVLKVAQKALKTEIEPRFIENPYIDKYQTFTKANLNWGFKPDYTVESGIKDYFENYE